MKLEEKMYKPVVRPAMIYDAWDATKKNQKRFRGKSCEHVEMDVWGDMETRLKMSSRSGEYIMQICNVTETIEVVWAD